MKINLGIACQNMHALPALCTQLFTYSSCCSSHSILESFLTMLRRSSVSHGSSAVKRLTTLPSNSLSGHFDNNYNGHLNTSRSHTVGIKMCNTWHLNDVNRSDKGFCCTILTRLKYFTVFVRPCCLAAIGVCGVHVCVRYLWSLST